MRLFHIQQCSIHNRNVVHFCSEWGIVGYGTGAFWDLWIRSIIIPTPGNKLPIIFRRCKEPIRLLYIFVEKRSSRWHFLSVHLIHKHTEQITQTHKLKIHIFSLEYSVHLYTCQTQNCRETLIRLYIFIHAKWRHGMPYAFHITGLMRRESTHDLQVDYTKSQ